MCKIKKLFRATKLYVKAFLFAHPHTYHNTNYHVLKSCFFLLTFWLIETYLRFQRKLNFYLGHLQRDDVVKALLQMGLYSLGVLGLAKDFQQVIVGEEVESWEDLPLGLQVHVQGLLDLLKFDIHVIQLFQQTWDQIYYGTQRHKQVHKPLYSLPISWNWKHSISIYLFDCRLMPNFKIFRFSDSPQHLVLIKSFTYWKYSTMCEYT